ncbi:MAG: hypothetical protein R2836_08955 [Chitinophagales bacterium]
MATPVGEYAVGVDEAGNVGIGNNQSYGKTSSRRQCTNTNYKVCMERK